jgi:starvation-inducible DNA-binding protein
MASKTENGITAKARQTLVKILDHVLRDECSLSDTIRDYRWSVTGPNLYSLHRLFDEQRRQLDYWLEQVMERARSMGFGSRRSAEAKLASAPERPALPGVPVRSMVGDLLARHENMADRLRHDIDKLRDPGLAELLMKLVEFHETTAWMLRVVNHGPDTDQVG